MVARSTPSVVIHAWRVRVVRYSGSPDANPRMRIAAILRWPNTRSRELTGGCGLGGWRSASGCGARVPQDSCSDLRTGPLAETAELLISRGGRGERGENRGDAGVQG